MNRYVLVTGASSGIGRATALRLARDDFHVYAGVRSKADAEWLKREGLDRLNPVLLDVTDDASVRRALHRIQQETDGQGLYGLVNNAGVSLSCPQELVNLDHLRRQFDVNVFGMTLLTAACLPMIRKNRGRIVNVSSGAGRMATPLMGTYSASKFAVEGLSDALRVELKPWKIPVVVIEPGFTASDIHGKNDADMAALLARLPETAPPEYRTMIGKFRDMNRKLTARATPAEAVAEAIFKALAIDRPPTRYAVGPDAKAMMILHRILPDFLKDMIFGSVIGV